MHRPRGLPFRHDDVTDAGRGKLLCSSCTRLIVGLRTCSCCLISAGGWSGLDLMCRKRYLWLRGFEERSGCVDPFVVGGDDTVAYPATNSLDATSWDSCSL